MKVLYLAQFYLGAQFMTKVQRYLAGQVTVFVVPYVDFVVWPSLWQLRIVLGIAVAVVGWRTFQMSYDSEVGQWLKKKEHWESTLPLLAIIGAMLGLADALMAITGLMLGR